MKKPVFKQGQRIKLATGKALENIVGIAPALERNKPYTVEFHIWRGNTWYVVLEETGSTVAAYAESAFTHYESFLTSRHETSSL